MGFNSALKELSIYICSLRKLLEVSEFTICFIFFACQETPESVRAITVIWAKEHSVEHDNW